MKTEDLKQASFLMKSLEAIDDVITTLEREAGKKDENAYSIAKYPAVLLGDIDVFIRDWGIEEHRRAVKQEKEKADGKS